MLEDSPRANELYFNRTTGSKKKLRVPSLDLETYDFSTALRMILTPKVG